MIKPVVIGLWVFLSLCVTVRVVAAAETVPEAGDATITSDQLELHNNGEKTIFSGHVVLIQPPYRLEADRMTRIKSTGISLAEGHVRATWINEKGEKVVATGKQARYDPRDQTSELWGDPEVTRWETAHDTAPVVLSADRVIVKQQEHTVFAHENVWIRQGARLQTRSQEAKYIQTDKTIHLWGNTRVAIHVEDGRGVADFVSDRAWVLLDPKQARLISRVTGHVIPSPSL